MTPNLNIPSRDANPQLPGAHFFTALRARKTPLHSAGLVGVAGHEEQQPISPTWAHTPLAYGQGRSTPARGKSAPPATGTAPRGHMAGKKKKGEAAVMPGRTDHIHL